MKISLTRPAYSPLYQLITSKTRSKAVVVPLGLLYVAGALEIDRHQVEIVDGEVDNLTPGALVNRIGTGKPDVVGAGATTVDFEDANLVLRGVKEKFNVITVLGGAHATVLPDQVLRENPHIDYLVRGEGEITTRELLRQLEQNESLSQIEGVSYREGEKIIHNPDRLLMVDLDKNCLPARHLIDQSKYRLPLPGKGMKQRTEIQAMRGCPFKCIYCYRMFGNKVRFRNPMLVADEIEDCVINHGVEYISFRDDTFMVNADRVFRLCEEIARRKLKFSWHCFTRADTIREDLLRLMKKVGCKQISIGVESGNQEILDIANKDETLEQYIEAYRILGKVGFEKRGSFILGLPYDNPKTLRDTIDFAKRLKLDRAFFNISTPYPKTRMFEMAQKGEGLHLITESWKEFKRWGNAVIELEGVTSEELKEWQRVAMMEFYARPRIILYHLKTLISGNHEKFYYRPLMFGLKEFYKRKIKSIFYRCARKIYWTLNPLHLEELLIGTKAREKHWATRSIAEGYWKGRNRPSRCYIAEKVISLSPVHNILEVGCASGPSLYLLSKRLPKVQFVGIDINQEAVQFGNRQFTLEKIPNTKLLVGRADKLGEFKDKSFDVVFTHALLICIGPDKIKKVIEGLLRITRHTLVLFELHHFEPNKKNPLGFYHGGNWIRDYKTLLEQFIPEEQIQVTQHLKNVWLVKPWLEYGAVIEATVGKK